MPHKFVSCEAFVSSLEEAFSVEHLPAAAAVFWTGDAEALELRVVEVGRFYFCDRCFRACPFPCLKNLDTDMPYPKPFCAPLFKASAFLILQKPGPLGFW